MIDSWAECRILDWYHLKLFLHCYLLSLSKFTELFFLCPTVSKFHNNVPHSRFISIYCTGHSVDTFNLASQFWGMFLNYFVDYYFLFISLFLEPILLRHWISWIGFFIFLIFFSYFQYFCLFLCASVTLMGNFLNPPIFWTHFWTHFKLMWALFYSLKIH